jgi:O-antigen/teichoic acid export membrane protein
MTGNIEQISTNISGVQDDADIGEIFKDVCKYAPSKILGTLINLAFVPIYTNLLIPSEYGLYNVAIAVLSFLAIIFSDWIGSTGLRFYKEHHKIDNVRPYFSTLLFIITANLILMFLFIFLFFGQIKEFFHISGLLLACISLLIIPVAFRALFFQILRAQIKPLAYSFIVVINQLSTIAIAYYLIKNCHLGAEGILIAMGVSILVADLIMFFWTGMYRHCVIKINDLKAVNTFYRYGIPIALSSLSMWLITQSSKLILQHYHGSYYNGIAGVAYNLTFSLIFPLCAIFTLASIPRIINLHELKKDVKPIITKMTGYYIIIFAPVVFAYVCLSSDIVLIFSNARYSAASIFMPFLAVSAFLFGLAEYTVIQYHLAKKTYIEMIIKVVPGMLGLIISIIAIPMFKDDTILYILGITSVLSQLFYFLCSILINIKNLEWKPPYAIIFGVIISLTVSYLALILCENCIHTGVLQLFVIKNIVIVASYLVSLMLINKIVKLNTI